MMKKFVPALITALAIIGSAAPAAFADADYIEFDGSAMSVSQPSEYHDEPAIVVDTEMEAPAYDPDVDPAPVVSPRPKRKQPGRGEVTELAKYWRNDIPTYISYAETKYVSYNTETKTETYFIEVGIVGLDDEKKQEILDIVSPDCEVNFVECELSYYDKEEIADIIRKRENIADVVTTITGADIIVITETEIDDEYLDEYAKELANEFGADIFTVDCINNNLTGDYQGYTAEAGMGMDIGGDLGGTITTGIDVASTPTEHSAVFSSPIPWIASAAAALIAVFGAVILVRSRSKARVTSDGRTVSEGKLSRAETEAAVKSAEQTPPDGLYGKITDELHK